MTTTITQQETTTLYVNQSTENWVVDIGGSITVANGHGMVNYDIYESTVMTTSGDIIADGLYKSGMLSTGDFASLQVDTTGTIHAYNGMAFYGDSTYAENRGLITAANIGIYGNAESLKIANFGTINAKTGIYVESADAVYSGVNNYGTVNADYGVIGFDGGLKFTNYKNGIVNAKLTAVTLDESSTGANTVFNSGLITSKDIAILGSSGRDVVDNYGTIKGKISLGAGNDVFNGHSGTVDHAVDGGLGDDTYLFGTTDFAIVDAGGWDTISSITSRSLASYAGIENLVLLGTAIINGTGNAGENMILGNEGNNVLDGGVDTVVDYLAGGLGNDTYVLGAGSDTVIDRKLPTDTSSLDGGVDTITSTISRSLADSIGVENLELLGKGNLNATGNGSANVLTGTSGNNILDGGANEYGDVIDTLNGGVGNDTYVLGSGHDKVVDSGGIDTITSEISRSLADYPTIENLTLVGNGNNAATGNALSNVIIGNGGNNILDGGVDTVVDTLKGGNGNDYYLLGSGNDTVVDTGGMDTITSLISRNLATYSSIENLSIQGSANANATGNAAVNLLSGNAGNNVLDGGVDSVVDSLFGGDGNDTYVLGSGADLVSDGGGTDTITSTISRSLTSYSKIENLTLTGSADIDATGNQYDNVLTGNSGMNTLNGGDGNDTYVLGSGNDKVVDSAGTETITSSIGRSLASYATIENLTLTGNANVNATGNALNNVLTGNSGMNTLDGGAGNDTYVLGSGSDKVVDSAGTDIITSLTSRNLSTFATIENLKLLGAANVDGTGNALANTLTGNSGVNALSGAAGNDVLNGGAGADKLDGGADTDTASYAGASAGVFAALATASSNTGDAKGDTYVSIENLTGSSHSDTLRGDAGANVLTGGIGADMLTGGTGADTFLFASVGDTTDVMTGQDTVFDFSHSHADKISLSGIDANTAIAGDQGFVFKGSAAFSGANGELRFDKQASDTYVFGDTNGDKVADFVIHFDDAITFQASDFLL